MGWIFIVGSGFDGPHGKVREKYKVGKGLCCHFWPDWHYSWQQVIHSEREEQVPLLLLPAQVYDNPNKLWCAAQTLKTVIGTKSNRLCLSGQRELRERLCMCSSPLSLPTINFFLSSSLTSLQVHLPIPLFSLFFSPPLFFGSTCNFPLLFGVLFVLHLLLQWTWEIQVWV